MNRHVSTRLDALLREARMRIDDVDAQHLLAHVLDKPHSWLYAHADAVLPPHVAERFDALVARRSRGEPVAYLTGRRGFHDLDLMITADTLIPRPETEVLVELALQRLRPRTPARVADLGTGSGAVGLAIARARPEVAVVATDRSVAALAVARGNAAALGIANVSFREGDWYAALDSQRFELIASNPPYIAGDDPHLGEGDLRFEPRGALTPGGDGLDAIRWIIAGAPAHLQPQGWLLLEHGHDQGGAVRALLSAAGFVEVATEPDLEHRDRVSLGQWPSQRPPSPIQ
ncbi:peptide chain release factor N(5)-glutamine methyltransferase [Luteimonas sp. RIT-PG2_3]